MLGGSNQWLIGVLLRFSTNGPTVMRSLANNANLANASLARQQGLISKADMQMMRYQARMESLRMQALKLGTTFSGALAFGGGLAMTAAMRSAGELQQTMARIQIATGARPKQLDQLRQVAYDISDQTAQSVNQSARIMAVMASAGINNPSQLARIARPAAQFADVQYLSGKASFEDAARQAIQIAHLYQAYTPQQIAPILDKLTKLSFMMPDNLNRYLTQSSYYMPLFRRMGVDPEQSLVLGAFMDRMGLGRTKGGTASQNFLLQMMKTLQLTTHVQGGRKNALTQLGMLNPDGTPRYYTTDAKGQSTFDVFGALERVNTSITEQTKGLHGSALTAKRAEFIGLIQQAFGVQGARLAYLATPAGIAQLQQMLTQLHRMPSMAQDQRKYLNTVSGQAQRAYSNVASVLTEVGTPWLEEVAGFFSRIADIAHRTQAWLHGNRDWEKRIGGIVAGLTAAFGVRTVIGVGSLSAAVVRFGKATDVVTAQILKNEWKLTGGSLLGGAGGAAAKVGVAARISSWAGTAFTAITGLSPAAAAAIGAAASAAGLLYGASVNARLHPNEKSDYGGDLNRGGRVIDPSQDVDVFGRPIFNPATKIEAAMRNARPLFPSNVSQSNHVDVKVTVGDIRLPNGSTLAQIQAFVDQINAGVTSGMKQSAKTWTHPHAPLPSALLNNALGI